MPTTAYTKRWNEPDDRKCVEAYQALEMLTQLIDELRGMWQFVDMLRLTRRKLFKHHKTLGLIITAVQFALDRSLKRAGKLARAYEQYIADYEHRWGKVDHKPLRHLPDLAISFEEICGLVGEDRVMEDFFDE